MYDIKLGQGCGIKATMLTPTGGVCDLRRARYIAASLVLLRDAALVGGYLDGIDSTKTAFVRAARQAAGISA